jgi:hypothetical protein
MPRFRISRFYDNGLRGLRLFGLSRLNEYGRVIGILYAINRDTGREDRCGYECGLGGVEIN